MSWRSVLGKITEVQSQVRVTSTRRRGRPRPASIGAQAQAHASRASALIGMHLRDALALARRSRPARRGLTLWAASRRPLPATMALTWGNATRRSILSELACELVTNALRHGAGTITIQLSRTGHDLRIEVHDQGAGRPVRRHAGTGDEGGRGLEVIDGLIGMHYGHRGCTDDTGPGKTVYVVMSLIATETGR